MLIIILSIYYITLGLFALDIDENPTEDEIAWFGFFIRLPFILIFLPFVLILVLIACVLKIIRRE